jgi:vitamin B12 transporter
VQQNQVGVYGALNYGSAGFNAEAGGRYNHHSTYGSNGAFNINPSYLIQNRWKVFANLSSGYKTPSLYQLYSEYGNTALKPENAINLEGGLQYFSKRKGKRTRHLFLPRCKRCDLLFLQPRHLSIAIHQPGPAAGPRRGTGCPALPLQPAWT